MHGDAVAGGRFAGGPTAYLAIGVPGLDLLNQATAPHEIVSDAGWVEVYAGRSSGVFGQFPTNVWTQDSQGIDDVAEPGDRFGG